MPEDFDTPYRGGFVRHEHHFALAVYFVIYAGGCFLCGYLFAGQVILYQLVINSHLFLRMLGLLLLHLFLRFYRNQLYLIRYLLAGIRLHPVCLNAILYQ